MSTYLEGSVDILLRMCRHGASSGLFFFRGNEGAPFAICNAEELGVRTDGYSLWGGSAGARMAAALGNADNLRRLTGRRDITQAAAVVMQYTGYTAVSSADAPWPMVG